MTITLEPALEAALKEASRQQGIPPEVVALNLLRERLMTQPALPEPRDEWERNLRRLGKNIGARLPHSAWSSDEIYE